MNFRRGLFRFWILLSALWVVTCTTVAALDSHWFDRNSVYEIAGPNGGKYEVEAPATASTEAVVAYVKQTVDLDKPRPECTKEKWGPWCDYPLRLKMPRTDDYTKLMAVAALPPIALLLLGASLYWVFAGFKQNPAKEMAEKGSQRTV